LKYTSLILDKGAITMEERQFFTTNDAGTHSYTYAQITLDIKINSKWIINLNVKQIYKTLRK
jgi:hypothetical protein